MAVAPITYHGKCYEIAKKIRDEGEGAVDIGNLPPEAKGFVNLLVHSDSAFGFIGLTKEMDSKSVLDLMKFFEAIEQLHKVEA